jgi:hypothetical protein
MDDATFLYKNFRISDDQRTVFFDYAISHDSSEYQLSESLTFPVQLERTKQQLSTLRALHLALGISYYKIFVAPQIKHPYQMDEAEAEFWNDVWEHGLGEFLYVNQLSPDKLARFTAQDGTTVGGTDDTNSGREAAILGIGGGKDSVVAGELLKKINLAVSGFVMATGEQLGQAKAVADTMEIPLHIVERSLDKQLLTLQELPGAYKGHIPISLIFGLVGTVLAAATDSAYVVVANEASASIPRVTWEHGAVNHQWSKSFEFEQELQSYIHNYIAPITYCSAIRELTSVAVAKLFAALPQYFEVFTSDNSVFRIDPSKRPNARWSLESPKSLSSFILLAPWLREEDMIRTFGRDFLNEASLETLFWELTGQQDHPPLDCVGTVEELVLSLNLAVAQGKFADSALLRLARERDVIYERDWQAILTQMLSLQAEQALPEAIQSAVHQALAAGVAA